MTARKKKRKFLVYLQRHIYIILLTLLCIGILISHSLYVAKTHQYPEMDEQLYIGIATEFYRILSHPTFDAPLKMNQYLLDHLPFRPPLYPLSITSLLLLFGLDNSYKIALWLNGVYFITTIIFIYLIARKFFSKTASLVSSILFASYGWTLFYLHFTYSETATTTLVVMATYLLIKTDYFRNKKYSILFGFAFALGLFVRWIIPLFLFGPLLLTLYKFFTTKNKISIKILINIGWVVIIFIPVIIFHIVDVKGFGDYITSQAISGPLQSLVPEARRTYFSPQAAFYYFKVFEQLTIFFLLLFLTGFGIAILKLKKYGLLTLGVLIPYIIFSFAIIIKDDRYIVPIYPFIALTSAVLVDQVSKKIYKTILILGIVILCLFSFFGAVWAIGPMSKGLDSILIRMPIGHARRIHISPIVWPPTKNMTNANIIVKQLSDDIGLTHKKNPMVLNLFSYHPLDNAIYSINTYQRLKPLQFVNLVGSGENSEVALDTLKKSDYLILKSGIVNDNYFPPVNYALLNKTAKVVRTDWKDLKNNFMLIGHVFVPLDKSYVEIYRRRSIISKDILGKLKEKIGFELKQK